MDSTEEFLRELSHIQENLSGSCKEAKPVIKALKEESEQSEPLEDSEAFNLPVVQKPPISSNSSNLPVLSDVAKEAIVPETSTSQLSEYVVDQIKDAVTNGMMTLKDIQSTVSTCLDGKVIKGYADLLNSIVKGLDTINNLNIAKQSAENSKELEKLKHEQKKEILANKNDNLKGGNINVFVGGREALMKIIKNQDFPTVTSKDSPEED